MSEFASKIGFGYDHIDEAWPPVEPGVKVLGSRVLVQIRSPKTKTAGGIILTKDIQETELANTQIAKVIQLGPLAFRNRNTMELWPEGEWCQPGEFVRVPRYGGDRWEVPTGDESTAQFVIFKDLDIVGIVTGDPLAMRAFL